MTRVIIVMEPHLWDKTFEGRIQYPREIEGYLIEVRNNCIKYQEAGDKVIVIFMGDIFHRTYSNAILLIKHIKFFTSWAAELDGELYSIVGNHEVNFSRVNPFWMLCDLQSKYFDRMKNIPEYLAASQVLRVPDELQVGNDLIVFGHFNREEFNYDWDKYENVYFLSHNSLLDTEVNNAIKNTYHLDVKAEYIDARGIRSKGMIPITDKLRHVFVGHMHNAFGKYHVTEDIFGCSMDFLLEYVKSIGRTNHTEVNEHTLRRLPMLTLGDTNTLSLSYMDLELKPRSACVNEGVVLENQEKYQEGKDLRRMKSATIMALNPIDDIRSQLKEISPDNLGLFETLLQGKSLGEVDKLIQEANDD